MTEQQRLHRNKYAREWAKRNSEKVKANVRRWCKANPEQRKQIQENWRVKNPAKISAMRARKRGLAWNISDEEYAALRLLPCHYCYGAITTREGGLDRIDNSKGYDLDNVVPCCYSCNVTRSDIYTVEEMKVMISALKEYREKKASKC